MIIYDVVHQRLPSNALPTPFCCSLHSCDCLPHLCAGYTKQVMVIYNGVHYDALAIAASPRAEQDADITEYNPRTRRGKMILAAAQQLVRVGAAQESGHVPPVRQL